MKHVSVSPSEAASVVRLASERLGSALSALQRRREAQMRVRRWLPLDWAHSLPALGRGMRRREAQRRAARELHLGAGVLALAVLADSGVEHYRGSFQNQAMFAPLASATLSLFAGLAGALGVGAPAVLDRIYRIAEATGFAGFGFHAYNILKRPSGLVVAQPLLWRADRRADGARAGGLLRSLRVAGRRRGERSGDAVRSSRPAGSWRRRPPSVSPERSAKPGSCISAAPITPLRWLCP